MTESLCRTMGPDAQLNDNIITIIVIVTRDRIEMSAASAAPTAAAAVFLRLS